MKPYEKLHATWPSMGCDLGSLPEWSHVPIEAGGLPLPSTSLIGQIEQRFDVVLPPDFRDYLLRMPINGEGIVDNDLVAFWSVDRVLQDNTAYEASRWLGRRSLDFCDHLLDLVQWTIQCEPGPDYGKVASSAAAVGYLYGSFAECVDAYASDHAAFTLDVYGVPKHSRPE